MEIKFVYLVLVFGYGGHGGVFGRYWIDAWLIGWGFQCLGILACVAASVAATLLVEEVMGEWVMKSDFPRVSL